MGWDLEKCPQRVDGAWNHRSSLCGRPSSLLTEGNGDYRAARPVLHLLVLPPTSRQIPIYPNTFTGSGSCCLAQSDGSTFLPAICPKGAPLWGTIASKTSSVSFEKSPERGPRRPAPSTTEEPYKTKGYHRNSASTRYVPSFSQVSSPGTAARLKADRNPCRPLRMIPTMGTKDHGLNARFCILLPASNHAALMWPLFPNDSHGWTTKGGRGCLGEHAQRPGGRLPSPPFLFYPIFAIRGLWSMRRATLDEGTDLSPASQARFCSPTIVFPPSSFLSDQGEPGNGNI